VSVARRLAIIALIATVADLAPVAAGAGGRDLRLIDAVRTANDRAARSLIASHVDVNATQPDGATALHWAAERDASEIADALLKAGARPSEANDYGVTPIALAAANGSARMIERLLNAGVDVNTALPTGETTLMTAARTGTLDAVRLLLAWGANVDAQERVKGQTALHWAIWQGHTDVVHALVEAGASTTLASHSGFTPLLFAVREGNIDAVQLLSSKGASVNETAHDGASALHVAVVRGQVAIAKFLLDHGADPNASGPGYTPLHWASGIFETIHTHDYIFNGIAVNNIDEWAVLGGIPSQDGKHELIKALLAKGADINARTTRPVPKFGFSLFKAPLIVGATPFYLASLADDAPTMKLLVANGADPNIRNNDDNTPLIVAAGLARIEGESSIPEAHAREAVELLLSLGSDIQAVNKTGNMALHAAAMAGLDRVVEDLVRHGAPINARNKDGATPLKLANGYIDNLLYVRPSTAALLKTLGATE
jgi:ankyrin repeat protein